MGKKLTSMSWEDMQKEMSIAGNPEKIAILGNKLMKQIEAEVDCTNHSELINIEFALERIKAEIRLAKKICINRHR